MTSLKKQWLKKLPKTTYSQLYCPDELEDVEDFTNGIIGGWRSTNELYKIGAKVAPTSTWAEFGVGCGNSSKKLGKLLSDIGRLYLFDSWEGIPESWVLSPSTTSRKGSWSFSKLHTNDDRVEFVDGWYKDTLPHDFPEQLGLINIDCDIYSSTRDVLFGCDRWIGEGTVIVFDELLGYRNYAEHEYKALQEWLSYTGKTIEWLGKERFAAIGIIHDP
ncbi:hypothetical protein LCGC14_1597030 [marine sediment metagenome]|uniref:Methyltransferase FkbM domain-containing protein n=1 Tax=marine sediment metagenome TaxID=412755 RepID=A0A0F9KSX8_9ZZZZ